MSLDSLPSELYSAILLHVPSSSLQQTILSLTRAIPHSPVPRHLLFRSVRISHPNQVIELYNCIRSANEPRGGDRCPDSLGSLVFQFSLETWQADADVAINLIRLLPNIKSLNLWIGPNNFAPEHLEEMFLKYMPNLRSLSLRFRPYVQKATYYQFLKGAYFDSTLLAISAWPPSTEGLPTISIVQDPFTPPPSQIQRFAQPIVFFRLDLHVSLLIHSSSSSTSLKYLRIHIPSRPIVKPLTTTYRNHSSMGGNVVGLPPPIEILDISSCSVSDFEIEPLLVRFAGLKHLILDGCPNLLKGGPGPFLGQELDWWLALGKRCALASVRRAKEKEKELKAWFETQARNHASVHDGDGSAAGPVEGRRPRRGRRGLATATISLRASTPPPANIPTSSTRNATGHEKTYLSPPKIYIIPPSPSLLSISFHPTTSTNIKPEMRLLLVSEFKKGWKDGIRVLWERRGRIGTTFSRGNGSNAIFLKFKNKLDINEEQEGFQGLEDVSKEDENIFFEPVREDESAEPINVPVICISGTGREDHADKCGHFFAREIWPGEM